MTTTGEKGPQEGPFAKAALDLYRHGLAVIPVGGKDGKKPLVSWGNWKLPPGHDFLRKLITRLGAANVGVIAHLSGVTIIDVDDHALVDAMIQRFGDTPLKIATPSGGAHLWYRHDGERQVIRLEGMKVDVKGVGCFVVVPPSVRPSGPHAGKTYEFLSGSWQDLERLPKVQPGSLPIVDRNTGYGPKPEPLRAVKEGRRNTFLHRLLLHQARACDDFDALWDVARTINDDFDSPLADAEVEKTTRSAWDYESTGNNWVGTEARIIFTESQLNVLKENPDALTLRAVLQAAHEPRVEPFAVCPKAMARNDVIPGWGRRRYAKARDWLVHRGFLIVVHEGGNGAHDKWLFTLSSPIPEKGAPYGPNINKHPPPALRDDSDNLNSIPVAATTHIGGSIGCSGIYRIRGSGPYSRGRGRDRRLRDKGSGKTRLRLTRQSMTQEGL